ncbi:uncharacterized protein LOC144136683 isoform X3 [Amblyomma americanum]
MFGYTKERNTAAAATYLGDLGGNDSSECLREVTQHLNSHKQLQLHLCCVPFHARRKSEDVATTPCSRLTESGNAARLHCVHSSMEQAAGGSRGGT